MIESEFAMSRRYLLNIIGLITLICSSQTEARETKLSFDDIDHAQISIERAIYGLYRQEDRLWLLPNFGSFIIESPYNSAATSSEAAFFMGNRDTAKGTRVPLPEDLSDSFWRGAFEFDEKLYFLDAYRKRFVRLDPKTKTWGRARDLVVDLARPPSDSRGEPTNQEIVQFRRKFLAAYNKVKAHPELFSDAELIPRSWRSRFDGSQVILATRIPGYPLVTMRCQSEGLGYCQFERACFLSPEHSPSSEQSSGLAIDEKRRRILIGNYKEQKIYVYRFQSCYHIALVHTMKLPEQLGKITAIHVDKEENLWVTTASPDSYRNASVYRWPKGKW